MAGYLTDDFENLHRLIQATSSNARGRSIDSSEER
jgi:hypothetical protein